MLTFACLSPHPPIILPTVGSPQDRQKVKNTIKALESLAPELEKAQPEIIIVSSPHLDWGIQVPLHFLVSNLKYQILNQYLAASDKRLVEKLVENWSKEKSLPLILPVLTDSPEGHQFYFQIGKLIARQMPQKRPIAWIASGDLSHVLSQNGPYGFNPAGPKFDQELIRLLKAKNLKGILDLPQDLIDEAGECGLRSFSMLLGALEELKVSWHPEILSYEGPFGVGYLVANLKTKND